MYKYESITTFQREKESAVQKESTVTTIAGGGEKAVGAIEAF
jgi:hypothetical protein